MAEDVHVAVVAFDFEVAVIGREPGVDEYDDHHAALAEDERPWRLLTAIAGVALDGHLHRERLYYGIPLTVMRAARFWRERRREASTEIDVAALTLAGILAIAACSDGGADRRADAARAQAAEAKAREDAAAAREAQRLAALWTYHDVPAEKGRQLTASIYSANDVDTDGTGGRRVQLVFRDHPSWGRNSYIVLQGGDFRCAPGCSAGVAVDDGAPKPMAARRPRTDEAIAMLIDDARALWRLTAGAKRLSIAFPVNAGGTRTAVFDVAGLDRSKLPRWDD